MTFRIGMSKQALTTHFPLGMQKPYNMSFYPGTGCADGRQGDHIIVAPAYNVTADEVQHIVETMTAVIHKYFNQQAIAWLGTGFRFGDRELELQKPRK